MQFRLKYATVSDVLILICEYCQQKFEKSALNKQLKKNNPATFLMNVSKSNFKTTLKSCILKIFPNYCRRGKEHELDQFVFYFHFRKYIMIAVIDEIC